MAKQTKKSTQRKIGKQNKQRGNNFERKIAKDLRDLGFTQVVTSRSESKSTDDNKVDIIDKGKKWFFYNKGGSFRSWYGNIEHVLNMENDGYDIK